MAGKSKKHRVFIVDDHPLVREGLVRVIDKQSDMEVCGEAESGEEALQKIAKNSPDIAIVDLSLFDVPGLDLIEKLCEKYPQLPVLVLSMHSGSVYAERALKAGARGYISKQENQEQVVSALRHVLTGQIYLNADLTTKILSRFTKTDSPSITSLSNREVEVFQLLGEGLTRRQIAERISVSAKTVDAHCTHIKEKLGLKSTAQLIQQAALCLQQQTEILS